MASSFTPPALSSHEGPAKFTPPPISSHEGQAPAKQGFLGAFWEGVGGKTIMDLMGGASRDPAAARKSIETLKGLASGLANEGPRIMKELDSAGEAIRKGDWGLVAHHVAGAAPLFGAGVQQAGKEWEEGNRSAALGHTLALFVPSLLHNAPAAVSALADTDAGATFIGGAKGAAKSLVETKPLTVKGIEIPVPTTVASAAAGGQAASMMGLPRVAGTVAGAAAPVVRGAIRGGRAALAERAATKAAAAKDAALAADAAKIPPDVLAELTRESGVPEATPPQAAPMEAPQGQPIPMPRPRAEDLEALARLQADQASRAATGPIPVEPQKLIGPGPTNVLQMPAAEDGSFVRAVPAEYPRKLTPGQPIPPDMTRPELDAALAQNAAAPKSAAAESTVLPQQAQQVTVENSPSAENSAPVIDPKPSPVHANGESKSAAFRGEEKHAGNTAAKAERIAQKMHESGVTAEMAEQIQAGMISDTQIRDGMPPRWGNVAQQLGETEPGSSVPGIIAKLRDLEAEAARKTGPMSNPKARAAAQALADEMAASAAGGK